MILRLRQGRRWLALNGKSMTKNLHFTPLLCAALGTAAGFYFLSSLTLSVVIVFLFVSLATICFFTVLASFTCFFPAAHKWPETDRQPRLLQLTAVCAAALSAGLILGVCAASAGNSKVNLSIPENKITAIEGVLLDDPRIITGGRAIVTLSLRKLTTEGGLRSSSGGEITIFFPQESTEKLREFGRGTAVFSEGRLRSSETGWTFSANSMHIIKPASAIERMRTGIRLDLISRFDGKSWGGLALALLLGIRDNLDTNLAVMYRDAGCSYILALSGMHLAILAALIAFFLKKPLGLKTASIAGAVIISLYCFIVGPMPSLNRAALMYLLGVIAILGALPRKPLSILSLSFLIQIVISPTDGYSISFILSYLALAGILVIGQPLYSLLAGKAPDFLLQPISASCGAFLATAGITSFTFGIVIPMGIITGIVLVPLTTVFMTGSFVWLIFDLLSFSGFFSLLLALLYNLMERIVTLAGSVPGISAGRPFVILALSIALSLIIVVLEYKRRAAQFKLQTFP